MDKIRLIAIPYYDSLSIRRNWKDIKQLYPDILQYFPDYDPEYLPSRKYFWEIFASLHYQDAKEIIDNERRRKFEKESNDKTKEIIINKEVLDLIQGSLYFSKKKGRALYNIKPKEYGNFPQRKRKLSELDGYEGNRLDISVFNKNRTDKRAKLSENNPTENEFATLDNRRANITNFNPFKKNYR